MKKLIALMFVLILFLCTTKAQCYKELVIAKTIYQIDCGKNGKGMITLVLPLLSFDNYKITLQFGSENSRERFKGRLIYTKEKWLEWDQTCLENNITEINKEIEYKAKGIEKPLATFGDYTDSTKPVCFYVRKNNSSRIVLMTGELEYSLNKFITSEGGYMVFLTPDELQMLIDIIDEEQIAEYMKNKEDKSSLLK